MAAKYFGPKGLTVAQQVYGMQLICPQFCLVWKQGIATWIGPVRPSAMSEEYQVKVVYKNFDVPRVKVLSPELRSHAEGAPIPHVYSENRLCLYLPGSGEWRPDKFIADTIIPWTSLWLYHYEVWQATREWYGGGIHPNVKEIGQKNRP